MLTRGRRDLRLPLPRLSDEQVTWIIHQVVAYIHEQRQTYRHRAVPLGSNEITTMRPFFPTSILNSARFVVLTEERVANPPFYEDMMKMGFEPGWLPDFAGMGAITFVDTVASHGKDSVSRTRSCCPV